MSSASPSRAATRVAINELPAEFEEIVVAANLCDSENFGEHLRDSLFDGRDRRLVHLGLEHGRGQSLDVRLARGGQRNRIEYQYRVGDHVAGQERRHRLDDLCGIHLGAGLRHDVCNETISEVIVGTNESNSLRNARATGQRGLDLAEFDTEPTDLDLEVTAAHVLHCATVDPPDHVTRAVQPALPAPRTGLRQNDPLSMPAVPGIHERPEHPTRTNSPATPTGTGCKRPSKIRAAIPRIGPPMFIRSNAVSVSLMFEATVDSVGPYALKNPRTPPSGSGTAHLATRRPRTGFATDDNHPQRVEPARIH